MGRVRQFTFAFANAVPAAEAKELYDTYHVAGSGVPLFQAATHSVATSCANAC